MVTLPLRFFLKEKLIGEMADHMAHAKETGEALPPGAEDWIKSLGDKDKVITKELFSNLRAELAQLNMDGSPDGSKRAMAQVKEGWSDENYVAFVSYAATVVQSSDSVKTRLANMSEEDVKRKAA